ncbi:helix-hairpin-helix domain-containing protein [Sinimarinibacterium sp. CAU 1509]|uniref:helix-hairpin-helix domain-containing protein n=1 Tax=Sinimarinibacterium sp. CAU 1509 TaxID=2562283 RepID=UPI00146B4D55|nr:helix-hairpin-helix domain-containing protein [Sinimarinibacterium sp. CAU 1509]
MSSAALANAPLDGVILSSYQSLTGRTLAVVEDRAGHRAFAIGEGLKWVAGERVALRGRWSEGVGAGRCLLVDSQRAVVPTDIAGSAAQLMSALSIDFAGATKLLSAFGSDIFDVLERGDAERLADANYSGPEVRQFLESWRRFRSNQSAQTLLDRLGLNEAHRQTLARMLGSETDLDVALRDNPYLAVIHLPGVDWSHADELGLELGVPRDSAERRKAAVVAALRGLGDAGHSFLPAPVLQTAASRLLALSPSQTEWDSALQHLRSRRLIAFDADRVYLPEAFEDAANAARAVLDCARAASLNDPPEDFAAMERAVNQADFRLPRAHFDVLAPALGRALTAIDVVGHPTAQHLAESFVRMCQALRLVPVVLCPAYWVAQALLERCPDERIGTAGALLGVNDQGEPLYENLASLQPDAVLVIGAERLPMPALTYLLTRRTDGCAVILAGDPAADIGVVRGRPFAELARAASAASPPLKLVPLGIAPDRDSPLGAVRALLRNPAAASALVGRFDLPVSVLQLGEPADALTRYAAEVLPKLGLGPAPELVCVTPTRSSLPRAMYAVRNLRRILNPDHANTVGAVGRTQLAPADPFLVTRDLIDGLYIPAGTRLRLITAHDSKGPVAASLGGQRILISADRVNDILQGYVLITAHMHWERADVVVLAVPEGGDVPLGASVLYTIAASATRKLVLLGSPDDVQLLLRQSVKAPYSLFESLLHDLHAQRPPEATADA